MARAIAFARTAAVRSAEPLRVAIVLVSAAALIAAERAFPLI